MTVTVERLRQLFHYDHETGVFTRLVDPTPNRGANLGRRAGYFTEGRWRISVDGKRYQAAQLAWLYMTGEFPSRLVDHHDRDSSNDRWSNLRLADKGQNAINSADRDRALPRGVHFRGLNYQAKIGRRHLGMFPTPEAAHAAYRQEVERTYGEYAPWR